MNTFKYLCLFLFLPLGILAQNTLSGTVVDDQNMPVPGVNILIENTQRGTTTDFDGNYTIEINNGEVLVFSYLGFKTQKISYTGQSEINVELEPDLSQLEEIVLIGYGTSTKKDLTGSVTAISQKDFTKGNIITPENLISGRLAGVTVKTSGAPGSGSEIRIRGGGSLNANNQPLIVVDGLPLSNDNVGGGRSILSSINPNDIESFSILKDAAATAIYGNRASAGVIIIKTKKGSKDFQVDFNYTAGVYSLNDQIDVFSAEDFRQIIAQERPDDVGKLGNANTNWQDEIYRVANSFDHNLSVRGQLFDKIPVRLSLGHLDQQGIRLTSEFKRSSVSTSINPTFFDDHLRVNINANYTRESNRFANGVEGDAIRFDPTQPVRDPNSPFGGFFEYYDPNNNNEPILGSRNPVASLLQRRDESDVDRFYGNLNLDYRLHFLPQVRAVFNLGLDDSSGSGSNELSRESINGARYGDGTFNGSYSEFTSDIKNTLFDAYLNYDDDITEDISLRGTVGYSYQEFTNKSFSTGETREEAQIDDSDVNTLPDIVLIGYIGRAFVSFKDKYIASYSIRRDGSSRFAKGNKWGTFQSVAFSWNISDEKFLEDSKVVSNLKLRASYGETGQQEIGPRIIGIESFATSQPTAQVIFGGAPLTAGFPIARNEGLTWETAKTYNIGIDYGFFNDRITGTLDVYTRDTEDLFVTAPVPEGSNFTNTIEQNSGTLNTEGIEFGINAQIFDAQGDSDKFDWNVNYNVTFLNQELDELANDSDIPVGDIGGGTGGFIQSHSVGHAPNSFWVYNQIYDDNGKPIEGAYADLNGDNIINDDDRYLFRDPDPDVTMGFQSTMNYKNFDLSFNMRASIGNYVYNNVNSARAQFRFLQNDAVLGNIPTQVLETGFQNTSDVIRSDIYIENASFLRMDNFQIGYTFQDVVQKNTTLRFWAGMNNVFVITDYSGLDPEVFGGIDNTIFPRPQTFLLGANFKF
ncbi:SusC/RagA family TonB-linked outer membrane protein [Flavobacterium sp. CS20]|uniref:SusC/RagA family TonB-linked outer membrane protein n=1 Tax=Flavobacterium sp. CS20 TaxID=2775246 RepID=UPI001B39DE78|nr:SusC/RagA family TonB-linked outer membrane protein [Flavobacterium sp. CS20]QTY27684.1 SusC/RagA family TonB-linked outer membrane protein [Flavobacterium sp. CS20]